LANGQNPLSDNADDDDDSDGISNKYEYFTGTDPRKNDTDCDDMPDKWEVMNGLDPESANADGDLDYDGVTNYDEYNAGTDPNGEVPTDLVLANDTITSGQTKHYGATKTITSGPAYIVESGADLTFKTGVIITLNSGFSANGGSDFNATIIAGEVSDANRDSDGDGMSDVWELANGLDPLFDDTTSDTDKDGVSNIDEYKAGTDPNDMQTGLVLTNLVISSTEVKDYRAINSITAGTAYTVKSGADVSFMAGNIIALKPGFRLHKGAKFQAKPFIEQS